MSLEDDPLEEPPRTAATLETIEKVHNIVLDDSRSKRVKLREVVGLLEDRVRNILHEEFRNTKALRNVGVPFVECR